MADGSWTQKEYELSDNERLRRIAKEVFFSVDCEFDGPCPPMNSMLSFGAVAFSLNKGFIGEYSANLELLEGAKPDPDTEKFWAEFPEQYAATRTDLIDPRNGMWQFVRFISDIVGEGVPVLATYPTVDLVPIYWYFHRFLGFNPFKWSSFDFKTYAMAMLKLPFKDTLKTYMPPRWFPLVEGTNHLAIDDARAQATLMINAMCEHLALPNPLKVPTDGNS